MSENITVTGNKAQFNEDVIFLKDIDIRGDIIFGDSATFNIGKLNINGDLETDNLLVRKDLDVLGESDFTGITTVQRGTVVGLGQIYSGDGLLVTNTLRENKQVNVINEGTLNTCLLYTSDAADE